MYNDYYSLKDSVEVINVVLNFYTKHTNNEALVLLTDVVYNNSKFQATIETDEETVTVKVINESIPNYDEEYVDEVDIAEDAEEFELKLYEELNKLYEEDGHDVEITKNTLKYETYTWTNCHKIKLKTIEIERKTK